MSDLSVIEGTPPEPKDFCEVCQKPNCTSWTVLNGRRAYSCSEECSEMVQGMRIAEERKAVPPTDLSPRKRMAKIYQFPSQPETPPQHHPTYSPPS